MAVIVLDPRFPTMIPLDGIKLVQNDVCYTDEVPVRIRWVVADLGGHVVDNCDVVVTTNPYDEAVQYRLGCGDDLIVAPTLTFQRMEGRQLEAGVPLYLSEPVVEFEMKEIPAGGELTPLTGGAIAAIESAGTPGEQPQPEPEQDTEVHGEVLDTTTEQPEEQPEDQPEDQLGRFGIPTSVMSDMEQAIAVMGSALRCGEWESQQTHQSLIPYLQEEVGELIDVISTWTPDDPQAEKALCAELSDVLLQVLFHAELANRRGAFDIGHVATAFVEKMHRRAPYLFEEKERFVSIEEQEQLWQEGKRAEQDENR